MPSKRIARDWNDKTYFLTFTIHNWYYIFDRYDRWDILKNSLEYCQRKKALKIYHYVFMLNHLHLIVFSHDVAGFVSDFKRFTAQKLLENIKRTEPTVLDLFKTETGTYELWKKTNMPIVLETEKVFFQKAMYIEANPVRKNYVTAPEHWVYSSANPNSPLKVDSIEED